MDPKKRPAGPPVFPIGMVFSTGISPRCADRLSPDRLTPASRVSMLRAALLPARLAPEKRLCPSRQPPLRTGCERRREKHKSQLPVVAVSAECRTAVMMPFPCYILKVEQDRTRVNAELAYALLPHAGCRVWRRAAEKHVADQVDKITQVYRPRRIAIDVGFFHTTFGIGRPDKQESHQAHKVGQIT